MVVNSICWVMTTAVICVTSDWDYDNTGHVRLCYEYELGVIILCYHHAWDVTLKYDDAYNSKTSANGRRGEGALGRNRATRSDDDSSLSAAAVA